MLALVVVVVTLVTLGVGVLGALRIRKHRPSLKSFEHSTETAMGSDSISATMTPVARAKTDAEKTDSLSDLARDAKSHMRANAENSNSLVARVGQWLWTLSGIPLLTDSTTTETASTMGNTTAPKRTPFLSGTTTALRSPTAVEVDKHDKHDALKAPAVAPWSDVASSDEDELLDTDDETQPTQTDDEKLDELRNAIMLDGLQFYTAVASTSAATVAHAIDIALFRATTIVLRERRKAHEDASIHAIEMLYPDIMCLPATADVRYASGLPMRKDKDAAEPSSSRAPMSPARRPLETRFLTAA